MCVYADGDSSMMSRKRLLTYNDPMIRGVYINFLKKGRGNLDSKSTQNLIFFVLVLCVMNKSQNRVGEVEGCRQQCQISHNQTDLKIN